MLIYEWNMYLYLLWISYFEASLTIVYGIKNVLIYILCSLCVSLSVQTISQTFFDFFYRWNSNKEKELKSENAECGKESNKLILGYFLRKS